MIQEIRVAPREGDPKGEGILKEIRHLGINSINKVRAVKVYRLEGISEREAETFARALLVEEISHGWTLNHPLITARRVIEVAYKPGVMNPESASILKAARDLGYANLVAADSSWEYGFYGSIIDEELNTILKRHLVNETVEHVVVDPPKTLLIKGEAGKISRIPIRGVSDTELMDISRDKLFLNLDEMRVIQNYFRELEREPTDAELETIAQTWSEHCGHKTFKARIILDGKEKEPLMARIKTTAERYFQDIISAFVDNSGVADFYEYFAVCGKVETHNSPSAIEPYGGAGTGSGGVFRDIMGTGEGAKVLASTDIFCFAPPDLKPEDLPTGCLHPHYLFRRVVDGVRDYGNRMGIPTNNGSVHFHPDFRAKPTVIVGSYGIIPRDRAKKGRPQAGDKIVVVGGRTGRDGIHGATFSSAEMTDRTIAVNASAVQIGNAIEEKRMSDALLVARDRGLIRAITDCGAGGFSSAIGEMASEVGAHVNLENAPLKYRGLAPWEIWLSESQERMIVALAPQNVKLFLAICRDFNVEATLLGKCTGTKRLHITYHGQVVVDLDMEFLYHGLPQRVMRATYREQTFPEPEIALPVTNADWEDLYKKVLGHWNISSKEPILRMYDHGVQGTGALAPFTGVKNDGPNDAVILQPLLGKPYGLVIAHGLNPVLNKIDSFWGSIWAGVEALSNLAAVGGDARKAKLVDNFIWPFPDEESLGALDRSVDACVRLMETFKIPFISGKDSLSSTYRGQDGTVIKIPPVLCVSVFGKIPNVARTVSSDFKRPDSKIVLLGKLDPQAMGGSVYFDLVGALGNKLPKPQLENLPERFARLFRAIQAGIVLACHDISEGGVAVALAEMCFGGDIGAEIDLTVLGRGRMDYLFFNEMAGSFLVETRADAETLRVYFGDDFVILGITSWGRSITAAKQFSVSLDDLKEAWQKPMREVFNS